MLWRYSKKDSVLFGIALAQFVATTLWAVYFERLSLGWNAVILLAFLPVFYFNPIVVTHNFLHCPFFKSERLNDAFTIFNSANLFVPQILYKYHHLIHHRYNNDPVRGGTTLDPSSTYRFGKGGRQEHFIGYGALSLFRDGTTQPFAEVKKRKQVTHFYYELAAIVVVGIVWCVISWKWFLFAFLPLFYFGWFLAHLENYFEHYRATAWDNRYANSVSYYGPVYNVFMFNEGYHQEHHIHPQMHWTKRPAVHEKYKQRIASAGAYRAKFPPLLGFLDALPHAPRPERPETIL